MSADDSLTFILLKFDCETSVLANAEHLPLLNLRLGISDHRPGIPLLSLMSQVSYLFHFSVIHYTFDVAFMFTVENYVIAW